MSYGCFIVLFNIKTSDKMLSRFKQKMSI